MGVRDIGASSVADRDDGYRWSDFESPDGETKELLQGELGLSPQLVDDAMETCLIPKVHRHGDHLLLVTHALDVSGHLLGLHLVLGPASLVTLHLRANPAVQEDESVKESTRVLETLRADPRSAPSPGRLALLLVTEVTANLERLLLSASERAGKIDREIREGAQDDDALLDPLFAIRRDLVTVQNRLDQTREAVESALDLGPDLLVDNDGWGRLQTRLRRLSHFCHGERDFFDGVLGLYEQRINVKMNFAMERLALITAVLLPVTAVAGIVGMNTIVTSETNLVHTGLLVVMMAVLVGSLLFWAKRRGWW